MSEEKCPICEYPFSMCQCRFSGSAHPNRDRKERVVIDHIYLLTDAQIEHLKKVEKWWHISYIDEETNQILKEMEQKSVLKRTNSEHLWTRRWLSITGRSISMSEYGIRIGIFLLGLILGWLLGMLD